MTWKLLQSFGDARKHDHADYDQRECYEQLLVQTHERAALKFAIGFFAPFILFLGIITALGLVGWAP